MYILRHLVRSQFRDTLPSSELQDSGLVKSLSQILSGVFHVLWELDTLVTMRSGSMDYRLSWGDPAEHCDDLDY